MFSILTLVLVLGVFPGDMLIREDEPVVVIKIDDFGAYLARYVSRQSVKKS